MNQRRHIAGVLLLLGGLGLGVGPLLPWLKVLSETAAGTGKMAGWVTILTGWIVLSAGANVLMAGRSSASAVGKVLRQLAMPVSLLAAWAAWLAGAVITGWYWVDIQGAINDAGFGTIGLGLWLQAIGLTVALVGLVLVGRRYVEYSPREKPPTTLGL